MLSSSLDLDSWSPSWDAMDSVPLQSIWCLLLLFWSLPWLSVDYWAMSSQRRRSSQLHWKSKFGTSPCHYQFCLFSVAKADYTAAAVLVSYGAVVGKLSPIQYLVLALVEAPVSILNEYLVLSILKVGDVGGSIIVHFFGAIFGIAVARIVFTPQHKNSEHQGSIYHSDIFSFVGTVFLWAFWPSFK